MSLSDLLFDTPWWIFVLLIGGGAAVWFAGNARLDRTLRWVGVSMGLAGLALMLLNRWVVTDKEHVERQTREIVAAFVDRNWDGLTSLTAPQTSVAGIYRNQKELIAGAKRTVDNIALKSATVTSLEITQNDTVITADVTILSTQDLTFGRPMPTNWRFDWENRGTGWMLDRIEPLEGRQVSKNELMSHMQR